MMDRSAGVDWASERHAICVLESDGRVVERSVSEHDAGGRGEVQLLRTTVSWMRASGRSSTKPVPRPPRGTPLRWAAEGSQRP